MEIVWSQLAYEHLMDVLTYVEDNFGTLVAKKNT